MANTLKFKRGLVATIPTAALGEPLFTTDTFDLYIGNGTTNTRFQKYIASGATTQILRGDGSLYTFPLAISSPSAGQVLKYNGTSWVNDSDAGITGSGTTNYLPKFTGASTLGNSVLQENSGSIGINGAAVPDIGDTRLQINATTYSTLSLKTTNINGSIRSHNPNGILYFGTISNHTVAFFTNDSEKARITGGGNFIINNASTDNGLRFQVTGDGYFSGAIGVGTSSINGYGIRISKNITSSITSESFLNDGTIQSDVTNSAIYNRTISRTAVGVALTNLHHNFASQGTLNGTVTNQFGFTVDTSLTGATNNYGFYGNIASGTGRWNLYMNGTANNYIAGSLGIGTASPASKLHIIGGDMLLGLDWASAIYDASTIRNFRIASNGGNSGYITQAAYNSAATANTTFFRNYVNAATTGAWVVEAGVGNFNTNNGLPSSYSEVFRIAQSGASTFSSSVTAASFNGTTNNIFSTGGTERMRLDASGNLGLGVTPSAWSLVKALQISGNAMIGGYNNQVYLGVNWVYDGADKYISNGFANRFLTSSGAYFWEVAPNNTSGAGAALTWSTRMTLDASGRLLVGGTSTYDFNDAAKLVVANTSANSTISIVSGTSSYGYLAFADGTSGTDRYTGVIEYNHSTNYMSFRTNGGNYVMNLTASQNVQIGSFGSDAGYKLDVNGTMRVSGVGTFASTTSTGRIEFGTSAFKGIMNYDAVTTGLWSFNNQTAGASTLDYFQFQADGTAILTLKKSGAATFSSSVTATIFANTSQTAFLLNNSAANNDFRMGTSSSQFRIVNAANTTALLTMTNTGETTFSSSVTCSSLVVDSTTLVVDATNNRVGVNTNVPTSSLHVVGSVTKSHTTKTANYTMTESDYTVLCDTSAGGFTISLPAASGCSGRIYVVKKITGNSGTNNITIDPNGSETIDGATTYTLQCRSSVMIQSNGANWWILAERVDNSCI